MPPIPRRAEGSDGSKSQNGPSPRQYGDYEHDGRFHQFGGPRAYAWDDPQHANRSEHEPRPEHERQIDHTSFQNRHNILLFLDALPIVPLRCPRVARRTIRHEQNTSRKAATQTLLIDRICGCLPSTRTRRASKTKAGRCWEWACHYSFQWVKDEA